MLLDFVASERAATTNGSDLCTQCALCCTGALHDHASADPAELDGLRELGMQVADGDEPSFAMPCPCLKGTLCAIYQDRPRACSRYRCQLLWDVEKGRTGTDVAVRTIA